MFLVVLCTLLGLQYSYAGSITIVNNSTTGTFRGYLMADNNVASPSATSIYGMAISVGPSSTLTYASPAVLPNPDGLGLPALRRDGG